MENKIREPIVADEKKILYIGKRGENKAVTVLFPVVRQWAEKYGAGVYVLKHRRNGDAVPYAAEITVGEESVKWLVTSTDNANPGAGECELVYYVDEVIAKSATFRTLVDKALDVEGPMPEPLEEWYDRMIDVTARSVAASEASAASAESASESATNAAESADAAAEKAAEAGASAENADISARAAQDAANSMSFVSFDIDPDGSLYVNRSERLGTTAFFLNDEGELEVSI